jgi:SAM-dependent methyltransferase
MTERTGRVPARVDYGIDAPGVIRTMFTIGVVAVLLGVGLMAIGSAGVIMAHIVIVPTLLWMGIAFLVSAVAMFASSQWGKLRARDHMLDRFKFTGDETVLDLGCGHGLMLIGAAKRVPRGRAIGLDLWSQVDQRSNSAAATMANAGAEGVANRVEVMDGDMRSIPLGDASVDLVLSCLAIHNIKRKADRDRAMQEIVRVLKPGGHVGIMDIAHIAEYAKALRGAGVRSVMTHGWARWIYPPARTLVATR